MFVRQNVCEMFIEIVMARLEVEVRKSEVNETGNLP